ncbi:hypothetical protein O181_014783 [Austropuccinia psidii MF-1]|uniref:Uncharacterized protein n=1 Tax=Austropuccinia psidii MF-1 TaxID=1389203 RepID=A0A9Q3C178_9BASI|nr:hypothetical protein [Austropuccinia psidii MF-1]
MKQMQDLLLTQRKKKGERREKLSYTPGASPSKPSLPRHDRPVDSPISPTTGARETSTPETEPQTQSIPRRVFVTTHVAHVHYSRKFQDKRNLWLKLKQNIKT